MSKNFKPANAPGNSDKDSSQLVQTGNIQQGIEFKTEIGRQIVQSLPTIFERTLEILKGRSDTENYVKRVKANIEIMITIGDDYVKRADANRLEIKEVTDAIIKLTDSHKDLLNSEEDKEVRMLLANSFRDLVYNYSQYLMKKAK